MNPIHRSQLVSVVIPANTTVGAKIFLPDIPELRDALVDGLETFAIDELAADLSANPTATSAELAFLTLSLVQESDRRAMDFPLQSLRSSQYGGIFKEFTGWRLNWQKCYIQVVSGTFAAATSVNVNVFYHYAAKR